MNAATPLYRTDLESVLAGLTDTDALRGQTVLITGATGLIGACLTDALIELNKSRGLNMRIIGLSRMRYFRCRCAAAEGGLHYPRRLQRPSGGLFRGPRGHHAGQHHGHP